MEQNLCEECEKKEAEYRITLKNETIEVCGKCSEKEKYNECFPIPLDELSMDDEEHKGWDDLCGHYND